MPAVDDYISEVIQRGDEGSALLAAKCAPTLKNSPYVQVLREGMNGLAVLRLPEDYIAIVHSATGDPALLDPVEHTTSMIDRLFSQSRHIGVFPLGLADVVDASKGDKQTVESIGNALAAGANKYGLAIMNGELAILGERVSCAANVSGTMVSMARRSRLDRLNEGRFPIAIFDPEGRAIYMNSDGVGTKTEFYERKMSYPGALRDSLAMKLDDAAKIGARAKVVFDVVETRGGIPLNDLARASHDITKLMGFSYLLHHTDVGRRLGGWNYDDPSFNVSGSAVSVIDEERLRSPLVPQEGDYLLAIRGKPNPRSNGITDKRKIMVKEFGPNWHITNEGEPFLEFLAEPSTIFYPVFNELTEKGSTTSVYHMSGGAYKGKLAKPLAQHGLYAKLEDLFDGDWRERILAELSGMTPEVVYAKWPMGNEGFVTTSDPERDMRIINRYGLESRQVGRLEKAADNKTGIELVGIKGSDGKDVYFSGK